MTVYGWAAVGIVGAILAAVAAFFAVLWAWFTFADRHHLPSLVLIGVPAGVLAVGFAVFAANVGVQL